MNQIVDKKAKAYAKAEMIIEASEEKIFRVLSDINRWPSWQSAVTKSQLYGKPEEGRSFTWKANGFSINSKFHTVEENSKLGWNGTMLWIKAVHNWWFIRTAEGTRVIVEEGLKGFGAGLMKQTLKRDLNKSLEELNSACQG